MLENQKNITELYSELSYAELKAVLENWLNPGSAATDDEIVEELEAPKPKAVATKDNSATEINDLPWEKEAPAKKADDVASAFDDLFNN